MQEIDDAGPRKITPLRLGETTRGELEEIQAHLRSQGSAATRTEAVRWAVRQAVLQVRDARTSRKKNPEKT